MIACCFSAGKEKNLSFIMSPPLTDSVNSIIAPLTDFEKTFLIKYLKIAGETPIHLLFPQQSAFRSTRANNSPLSFQALRHALIAEKRTRDVNRAMRRKRLYFFALPISPAYLPHTDPCFSVCMRKESKRGIPSSFCAFRTFRTSEK